MKPLNAAIADIPIPGRMRWLPISDKGFPVPWFVDWVDGKPDFRIADSRKLARAIKSDLCWLCGQTLGRFKCFTIGPMCAVNLTTAEPPSHRVCAEYAVKACPFLTRPRMRRNDKDLPENHAEPGGIMIPRNPGCILLWITHDYKLIRLNGSVLIRIGDPVEIVAYAEGRLATRDELSASIMSGLPILAKEAARDGTEAFRDFTDACNSAGELFRSKKLTLATP